MVSTWSPLVLQPVGTMFEFTFLCVRAAQMVTVRRRDYMGGGGSEHDGFLRYSGRSPTFFAHVADYDRQGRAACLRVRSQGGAMGTSYQQLLPMENAGGSPREVLTQPVTALLGASKAAGVMLRRLNIETIFDLAASGRSHYRAAASHRCSCPW